MNPLKSQFLLDPDVFFLNHGSFGATPKPVFETYQAWQRQLERQPVAFLGREVQNYLTEARNRLGEYLNCSGNDLFFVPNATFGVNSVARSLNLGPEDEVVTTDHEYGACLNAFKFLSSKRGYSIKEAHLPLPYLSDEEMAEAIWSEVTPQTKLIFMSHITSATAGRLPVELICQRASEAGILTLIDGAHVPGQLPLDLTQLGADFYTGNCHKWLCAPKGSAFLYTRPASQDLIEPLVVGWGYGDEPHLDSGSPYLNTGNYLGTNDLAAYLSVAAAIDFQATHRWGEVRQRCNQLLNDGLRRIEALTGLPSQYPQGNGACPQLGMARIPDHVDPKALKERLIDEYKVEIPVTYWRDERFVRISAQGYNESSDIDALIDALEHLL